MAFEGKASAIYKFWGVEPQVDVPKGFRASFIDEESAFVR
jgi:hypothetical protein